MDYNFFSEQYKTLVGHWSNFQKESLNYWQNLLQTWKAGDALQGKEVLKSAIEAHIEFLKSNVEKQQDLQNNYIELLAKVNAFDADPKTFNYAELAQVFTEYAKKNQELVQEQVKENLNLIKKNFEKASKVNK
jgi:hypothetical protein